MSDTGFELSKWYADCIDDDGEVIIIYVANLIWRNLSLSYSSLLSTTPAGQTESTCSIFSVAQPEADDRSVRWASKSFNFEGHWDAVQPPIQQSIHTSPKGAAEWECLQPLSQAHLRLRGRTIMGLGYVERLRLTIPPWDLPISSLRWGRFLAPDCSVVWIDWQGSHSARFVWTNAESAQMEFVDDNSLIVPNRKLEFASKTVLRNGALGKTVLSVLPRWVETLPSRVLGIQETKWRSRGTFSSTSAAPTQGWAIHEVVEWPK